MLENITHQTFEALLGESVELKSEDAGFRATVKSVRLLQQNPGHGRQPFSVELETPDAENRGQRMYQLSHPDLGDLSLFMVPMGPGEQGMVYEIVFN